MEKSARPAAGSMSEKREDPTQDFRNKCMGYLWCVCIHIRNMPTMEKCI